MRHRTFALPLAALTFAVLAGGGAHAKSWCANPLWVHEWGVHVFDRDGGPAEGTPIPAYFHTRAEARQGDVPVRELPPDSGIRDLPVVHFYAAGMRFDTVPVGLEVGFTRGAASAWFPAADRVRAAAVANAPASTVARTQLLAQRGVRATDRRTWDGDAPAMPPDPTRQLVWSRLDLAKKPAFTPAASGVPWVKAARELDALWVNGGGESERFVFYEGRTVERVPLALRRADGWAPDARRYVLANTGAHPVHDVFLVHNEADAAYVFTAATVPPGGEVSFTLDALAVRDRGAATADVLRARLVDPQAAAPPERYDWDHDSCVMGRDPAVPVEEAADHHLYRGEVDLLLGVWGRRFFEQPGTTVVYREDTAYLDAVMPLSVYTDMFNFVVLHRAGLAVWEHVALP
ncbi:MAG: hypothetical protein EP329_08395 [Deltaproteobacteria bacterium]|nr:MAG: hypothetical protein EP329_08395 [Deltaproteobacteria bacterium]